MITLTGGGQKTYTSTYNTAQKVRPNKLAAQLCVNVREKGLVQYTKSKTIEFRIESVHPTGTSRLVEFSRAELFPFKGGNFVDKFHRTFIYHLNFISATFCYFVTRVWVPLPLNSTRRCIIFGVAVANKSPSNKFETERGCFVSKKILWKAPVT